MQIQIETINTYSKITKQKFSKFIVYFAVAPMIWVQNQLEYAVVGRNVSLHCKTESYPQAIHFWRFSNGTSIQPGHKYR